jgi:imidazolonepropionase-like amidohydrolase
MVMNQKLLLLFAFTLILETQCIAQNFEFDNGHWYQNGHFIKKTVYSVSGSFSFVKPPVVDSIIDLKGQYCIPPFSDAHTHNLDYLYGLKEMINQYFKEGVFYVQVLGNHGKTVQSVRKVLVKENKVDVTYANGLLTATYGHGFYPYEPLAMGIYSPYLQFKFQDSIKKSRIVENDAYYFLDNIEDVDKKWPIIMQYRPDHLKICLLDAVNYQEKRKAEKMESYGLSPEVAAYVVKKAHASGLRVFAHIETADDARLCANIGVDVLAHLPGYSWNGLQETASKFCMTKQDARLFKRKGLSVIPTFNIDDTNEYDDKGTAIIHPERHSAVFSYKKNALRMLLKNGVQIALGSDNYGKTAAIEIDSLIANNVFSNRELLDVYCQQTAKQIFPLRKIGEIKEGYESNFLVLENSPLMDISSIKKIALRVRRGVIVK